MPRVFSVVWRGGGGPEPQARDGGGGLGGRLFFLPHLRHAPSQVRFQLVFLTETLLYDIRMFNTCTIGTCIFS